MAFKTKKKNQYSFKFTARETVSGQIQCLRKRLTNLFKWKDQP